MLLYLTMLGIACTMMDLVDLQNGMRSSPIVLRDKTSENLIVYAPHFLYETEDVMLYKGSLSFCSSVMLFF